MVKAVALFFLSALLLYHLHLGSRNDIGDVDHAIDAIDSEAGGCSPSDIKVQVVATGRFVGGKPERVVTFETGCPRPVGDIRVACEGLQRSSVVSEIAGVATHLVAPDPSKVEPPDEVCVLKQWISGGKASSISYYVAKPVNFSIIASSSECV
ncbi:hypothetical protein ACP4OV_008928 [Aristida adscensionis]